MTDIKTIRKEETKTEIYNILETSNKCCIIRPTGYGKTYMMMDIIHENDYQNILYIIPTIEIKNEILEKYKDKICDKNVIFKTYYWLALRSLYTKKQLKEELEIEMDLIIFDEMHKMGGQKASTTIHTMMEAFPNTVYIGATATPIRSDRRDLVEEFFDNNVTSKYCLSEAIRDGLLKKPHYIYSLYTYNDVISDRRKQITNANINDDKRNFLNQELDNLDMKINKITNLSSIFKKHITSIIPKEERKYMKFIIFTSNREELVNKHLPEISSNFKQAFPKYNIRSVVVTSYNEDSEDVEKLFKLNEVNKTIDLIFCIDKLNMGIHIENLTGIIMLRETYSNIIYSQQIGRCLSINNKQAIIFDLVRNLFRPFKNVEYLSGNSNGEKPKASEYYEPINMEKDVIGHDIVANIEDVVEKTDKIIEDNIAVYNYNTEATDEDSIIKCFVKRNMFVKDIQKRFPKYKIDTIVNILISKGIEVKDSDIGK